KVKLPNAKTGESAEKSPLEFTISKEGELSLGKDHLDWEQLPARLSSLGSTATDQTAVISADAATQHGTVVRLMDALRQAGITRFALNVESSQQPVGQPATH